MASITDTIYNATYGQAPTSASPISLKAVDNGAENVRANGNKFEALAQPTVDIAMGFGALANSAVAPATAAGTNSAAYTTDSLANGQAYAMEAIAKQSDPKNADLVIKPFESVSVTSEKAIFDGANNLTDAAEGTLAGFQSLAGEGKSQDLGVIYGTDFTDNFAQGQEAGTNSAAAAQEALYALTDNLANTDSSAYSNAVENGLNTLIKDAVNMNLTADGNSVVGNLSDGLSTIAEDATASFANGIEVGAAGMDLVLTQSVSSLERGATAIAQNFEALAKNAFPQDGAQRVAAGFETFDGVAVNITGQMKNYSGNVEAGMISGSEVANSLGGAVVNFLYDGEGKTPQTDYTNGNLAGNFAGSEDQVTDYVVNLGDYFIYNTSSNTNFRSPMFLNEDGNRAVAQVVFEELNEQQFPDSKTFTENENYTSGSAMLAEGAVAVSAGMETGFAAISENSPKAFSALQDGLDQGTEVVVGGVLGAPSFFAREDIAKPFNDTFDIPAPPTDAGGNTLTGDSQTIPAEQFANAIADAGKGESNGGFDPAMIMNNSISNGISTAAANGSNFFLPNQNEAA